MCYRYFSTIHNIRNEKENKICIPCLLIKELALYIIAQHFDSLDLIDKIFLFQFNLSSITTPKNCVEFTPLIFSLFILTQIYAVILRLQKIM